MAGSVNDTEYEITQRHAAQIDHTRAGPRHWPAGPAGHSAWRTRCPATGLRSWARPSLFADVDVVVAMNYWDMADLGSFPDCASVLGVQVLISGHPRHRGTDGEADVVLPEDAAGAWAAAVEVVLCAYFEWSSMARMRVVLSASLKLIAPESVRTL